MSDSENITQQYTVQDMVNYALKKDAANLSTAFNTVIGSKVIDAIQQKKIDIAKKIMNPTPDSSNEEGEEIDNETDQKEVEVAAADTNDDAVTADAETTTTGETNDEIAQQNT